MDADDRAPAPTRSAPVRRAPRLEPDEYIAGHVTRLGRFRRTDPLTPRRPARPARWLAVIGWAVLLEESLRRGRRAVREGPAS